ncbi:hypothetical protein ACFL3V_04245 [Nanoarchaeota archaeon]
MEKPTQDKTQPAQAKCPWYRRAGRGIKRGAKQAMLPVALTISMGAAAYGGFEMGRYYQAYDEWEDSLEEKLVEEKTERSLIRKGEKLYYHEKSEKYRMINPSSSNGRPKFQPIGDKYL